MKKKAKKKVKKKKQVRKKFKTLKEANAWLLANWDLAEKHATMSTRILIGRDSV